MMLRTTQLTKYIIHPRTQNSQWWRALNLSKYRMVIITMEPDMLHTRKIKSVLEGAEEDAKQTKKIHHMSSVHR